MHRILFPGAMAAAEVACSGTLNILVGANEGANSTTRIFGLYPYRADATSDGASKVQSFIGVFESLKTGQSRQRYIKTFPVQS